MNLDNITDGFEGDNLLIDKKNVMRRRSSLGRCLSKPLIADTERNVDVKQTEASIGLCKVDAINSTISSNAAETHVSRKENNCSHSMQIDEQAGSDATELDSLSLARSKIYKAKVEQLSAEHQAWKNVLKNRRKNVEDAKRQYLEAEDGQLVMTKGEILPFMSAKEKNFLSSAPDLNKYLQQISIFKERSKFLDKDIAKTMLIYGRFLEVCKATSKACYKQMESHFFQEVEETDVKEILRNMKRLSSNEISDDSC